jgi:hypothetical protein
MDQPARPLARPCPRSRSCWCGLARVNAIINNVSVLIGGRCDGLRSLPIGRLSPQIVMRSAFPLPTTSPILSWYLVLPGRNASCPQEQRKRGHSRRRIRSSIRTRRRATPTLTTASRKSGRSGPSIKTAKLPPVNLLSPTIFDFFFATRKDPKYHGASEILKPIAVFAWHMENDSCCEGK